MASFDSVSPPSEPPDIVNWFSSYVYESPILDSNDGIDTCIFKEGFAIEEDTASKVKKEIQKVGIRNELDFFERKRISNMSVECPDHLAGTTNQNSKEDQWTKMAEDIVVPSNLPSTMFSDQRLEEKTTPKHYNMSSEQEVEIPKWNDKVFEGFEAMPYINKSENGVESSERLLCGELYIEDESPVIAQTEKIRGSAIHAHLDSITTGTPLLSDNKENHTEDGFISTRKKGKARQSDKSFLQMSEHAKSGVLRHVKESISSTSKRNAATAKRKVLTESTNNLQSSCSSEIAGKWRCPQRSKPNPGPPLKQLRLEQWVHRV